MRIASRVVRGGAWFGLLLAVGYEVAAAASGTIAVTVFRESAGVPASGANVMIVGTQTGAITNLNGRATLTASAGTHQVRATLIGFCTATATVVVTEGQTSNVTLIVGASPCSGTGSSGSTSGTGSGGSGGTSGTGSGGGTGGGGGGGSGVDRVSTGGTQPLYGLVDVRTGAATDPVPCENDRLIEGTAGVADLLTNALTLSDPGVTCHGAAWVFTEDHAPWFSNTAATFPWSNATGDVLTAALPADRLRVPVTIWVSAIAISVPTYTATLVGHLTLANSFLRTTRSGLRLTNSETANTVPDIIDVGSLASAPYSTIGIGCQNTSAITSSTLVYRKAHLNVYVVEDIDGSGSPAGRNCREQGAANVIFLKRTSGHVVLLHEIGHALALSRPNSGHADGIKGLFPENLMDPVATLAAHLSLGQIARMHVDDYSWLNEVNGTGATTVRSRQPLSSPTLVTSCSCPGTDPTDDCPRFDMDIPRPGSPNAGLTNPACFVTTTSPPCVSLAPGASTTLEAKGWADAAKSVKGVGDGIVSSASPLLASAIKPTLGGEGPGFVKAEVKAGTTPGVTDILMWLGGTGVKVSLHIGSPCT